MFDTYLIVEGPGEHFDDGGRPVRNRRLMPCGCWRGEVYRDAPVGGGAIVVGQTIPMHKQWIEETVNCEVHAAATALRALQMSQFNGQIDDMKFKGSPLPPDSPGGRTLARAAEIQEAERQLNARLGVQAPPEPLAFMPGGTASPLPPLPPRLTDGRAGAEAELRTLYRKIQNNTATEADKARFGELADALTREP